MAKRENKRRKKIHRVLGLILIIILILVGAIIYLLHLVSEPVTTNLKAGSSTVSQPTYSLNLTPKLEVGTYVSFDYPTMMMAGSAGPLASPFVENFYYSFRDVQSWILAIDVSTTKTGNLTDSSDYVIRADNPAEYTRSSQTIGGQSIIIFTDQSAGGFNETAFLLHGTYLATVSLQGDHTSGTQPLQTTFTMVLNSWKWLQ